MARDSIHTTTVESSAIEHDAGRAFERASAHAQRIERIGHAADEVATADAFRNAPPRDLDQRATELRGHALHAVAAALELAVEAGRLEQIADFYRAAGEPENGNGGG